jgi:hypothetical protein
MTFGLPPSMTATQLLVVPKSIPMTLAMFLHPSFFQPLSVAVRQPKMPQFIRDIGGG